MDTEQSAPRFIEGKGDFSRIEMGLFDTPPSYYFECAYREGFKMIVADSGQQPRGMGAHFIGEEGWVHVNRSGLYTHPESLMRTRLRSQDIKLYRSDDHHQNFIQAVRSRKPAITPVTIAHHAILVGHLGNVAMKVGRRLEWDQETETFVGDETANRHLGRPMRTPWKI
jgi:hypothetical protein